MGERKKELGFFNYPNWPRVKLFSLIDTSISITTKRDILKQIYSTIQYHILPNNLHNNIIIILYRLQTNRCSIPLFVI